MEDLRLFDEFKAYFENREFQQVKTDSDTVRMFALFEKTNLYLVNLIHLKADYKFDIERYLEYKAITMAQFKKAQADKTILLNVILIKDSSTIYDDVNYTPDLEDEFIDVHWIIDESKRQLIIPSRQITGILRLEADFKRILRQEKRRYYKMDKSARPPIITFALMCVNIIIWMILELSGGSMDVDVLLRFGAMQGTKIVKEGEYYRLFSAMFLHIGFLHVIYNMFSLYIFGTRLEVYLKRWQFLLIYLGSGLIGSLMSLGVNLLMGGNTVGAGASGAIYGIMGSVLVVSKVSRKHLDGVNSYMIGLIFLMGLVYSVANPGIDSAAHLGGFLGGMLLSAMVIKDYEEIEL